MHQVRRVFKTASEAITPNTLGTVRPNQFRPAWGIEGYFFTNTKKYEWFFLA